MSTQPKPAKKKRAHRYCHFKEDKKHLKADPPMPRFFFYPSSDHADHAFSWRFVQPPLWRQTPNNRHCRCLDDSPGLKSYSPVAASLPQTSRQNKRTQSRTSDLMLAQLKEKHVPKKNKQNIANSKPSSAAVEEHCREPLPLPLPRWL